MKEKISSLNGSFVDFENKEHKYVIAAISSTLSDDVKILNIGISICNPIDKYDAVIGLEKAIKRARNNDPVLYTPEKGLINSETVTSILKTVSRFINGNPENYIAGYAKAKEKYDNRIQLANKIKNLTKDESNLYNELKKIGKESFNKIKEILKCEKIF